MGVSQAADVENMHPELATALSMVYTIPAVHDSSQELIGSRQRPPAGHPADAASRPALALEYYYEKAVHLVIPRARTVLRPGGWVLLRHARNEGALCSRFSELFV